jgi:hypothetical protein
MSKRVLWLTWLLAIVMLLLTAVGCDPIIPITYENRTSSPVWIDLDCVSKDFTGWHTPQERITDEGPIPPGESRTFQYMGIPKTREIGEQVGKYAISAIVKEGIDTVGTVIWQRIFTWTELYDMDWTVIIEP